MTLIIEPIQTAVSCGIGILILMALLAIINFRLTYKIVRRHVVKGEDGRWHEVRYK